MNNKQIVQLIAGGNIKSVEEAWLEWLEQEPDAQAWVERAPALKAMADRGNSEEAVALATTATDNLRGVLDAKDMLAVASAFLLALKDCDPLRQTVAELYREVYADVPGLDELMSEAGVEGGRPPRRAIRTMDVCLQLEDGICLSHRHEDDAVRVESVDRDDWEIEVTDGKRSRVWGAVELADNFAPAHEDDFRMMARFDRPRLDDMLQNEPGAVVENILRSNGQEMNSDQIKRMLTPAFIPAKEWSKWWTRARQALRHSPHVKIEGRSPYYLTYDAKGTSLEKDVEARLKKIHTALKECALIEEYLRGCKLRKQEPQKELLGRVRERIEERARRTDKATGKVDLTPWLVAARIAEYMEAEAPDVEVVAALKSAEEPAKAILAVDAPAYWASACDALEKAHPDNLAEVLEELLPHAPVRVADHLAERLIELGRDKGFFQQLAERMLRDPVTFNEGVAWLWNGPEPEAARVEIPLVSVATRLLAALGEVQRSDEVSKERSRQIVANCRDVFTARKFERFEQMLDEIDAGLAMALRTQVGRLDNIGRTSDDLDRRIREKFPNLTAAATKQLPRWQRPDVLYVTEAGHARKHGELEHMVNVKMRENAIAIGRAAEHGDLSENSEYKFALEERDLLQARLAQMQDEMDKCVIYRPDEVPSDYVGIGCRVELEHTETGARQTITILGPWEADQDKRIYNYLTPLAQAILGTKVNDTTDVEYFTPPGTYRVVEVSNALTEMANA